MNTRQLTSLAPALLALGVLAAVSSPAKAATVDTYLTDFTKNNNIYTNLNEQFPNTGVGIPGSGVGVPNATFLFDPSPSAVTSAGYAPNYIAGSNLVNNGVDFDLASDANGQDFVNLTGGGQSDTINAGVADATNVYLLMSAYNGASCNVTLTGSAGATQTFNNIFLPDFNGGGPINSSGTDILDQTVFRVTDVGSGGTGNSINGAYNNYDLTELSLTLDPAFASQTLDSVQVTSNGFATLLLGATVASNVAPAVPEPGSFALLALGALPLFAFARRRRA